ALFSVVALVACGGAAQDTKESDVWAGFKGTYAGPAEPRGETSSAKAEAAQRDAKSKTEAKEAVAEAPAKKTSKATIKGQSVSTVSENTLADASKGALKAKVVGSKLLV